MFACYFFLGAAFFFGASSAGFSLAAFGAADWACRQHRAQLGRVSRSRGGRLAL